MPLGSNIVAHARAVLTVDRGDFTHDLKAAQSQFHRYATEQEQDLTKLSARQVRARRLQSEYTDAVARFGPTSTRAVRSLERFKYAEEQVQRESRQATAVMSRQERVMRGFHAGIGPGIRSLGLFGRRSREAEQHAGRLGRGMVAGSGAFRGLGRSVAFASSYFLGGAGIVYGLRAAVSAASDLEEQVSKTNVVFGKNGREVVKWSETLANRFGISKRAALTYASSFGALLRPLGIQQGPAAAISKTLTERAADIASFYNTSETDALQAIQSGLVGQVRPLRRFGVQLSADRVKAFAFTSGIAKADVDPRRVSEAQDKVAIATEKVTRARKKYGAGSLEAAQAELTLKKAEDQLHAALSGSHTELTAAQKTLARYRIIMKDTGLAGGDFARTSGHLAQQQKILRAQIENITESIGKALMPTVLHYTRQLTRWLSQSRNQARVTNAVKTAVRGLAGAVKIVAGVVRGAVGVFRALNRVTGSSRHTIELLAGAFIGLKIFRWVTGFLQMRRAILGVRAASYLTIPALEALAVAEAGAAGGGAAGGRRGGRRVPGTTVPLGGALAVGAAVVASAGATRQYSVPPKVAEALKHLTPAQLRQLDAFLKKHHPHAKVASLAEAYTRFADFRAFVLDMLDLDPIRTADDIPGRPGLHATDAARRPPPRRRPPVPPRETPAETAAANRRGGFTQQAARAAQMLIPRRFTDAVEKAKLTKGFADDLKALTAEERYIRNRLEHTKRNTKLYSDLLHALTGVHGKIEAIHKKQKAAKKKQEDDEGELSSRAQQQMALLSLRSGFFGEFASNVFHGPKGNRQMGSQKTVIVHQHFNKPPASHFVNFRAARFAAQHAL